MFWVLRDCGVYVATALMFDAHSRTCTPNTELIENGVENVWSNNASHYCAASTTVELQAVGLKPQHGPRNTHKHEREHSTSTAQVQLTGVLGWSPNHQITIYLCQPA